MKTICMYCEPLNMEYGSHGYCDLICMHKSLFLDKHNLDKAMMQRMWKKHVKPYLIKKQLEEDIKISREWKM